MTSLSKREVRMQEAFERRMKKELIELDEVKKRLPCSLEAVDHLDEMVIEGKNKLLDEVRYA